MSSQSTVGSRLRVLVAKSYRAEQLYASMRHSLSNKPEVITDITNDYRAQVWLKAHQELRIKLNEIIGLPYGVGVQELIKLKAQFERKVSESNIVIERVSKKLAECSDKQEFASVVKLGLELVQYKSQAQAFQVVADELKDVLAGNAERNAKPSEQAASNDDQVKDQASEASNVVQFRPRRVAAR
ncbi:hypothetical protein JNK13_10765 [bacterium]|nr:hypothetical protein [bacterium]